jgi:hypothetical protein
MASISMSVPMEQRNASSGAHDRLTAHIEAGIHRHRTAGECLKARNQRVKAQIGFDMNRLHARGIITMG